MLYDLKYQVRNLRGEPIRDGEKGDGPELTIAEVIIRALAVSSKDDSGDKKYRCYRIAIQIQNNVDHGDFTTLSIEDCALIKEYVARAWHAVILGRIFDALENPLPKG
jgi:hypothetical protein